jgi:hypothetical protein
MLYSIFTDFIIEYWPIVIIVLILSVLLILSMFQPIESVYDQDDDLAFNIYQNKAGHFLVKGYNGYNKHARFKSYIDVVAYCDKKINGWCEIDDIEKSD